MGIRDQGERVSGNRDQGSGGIREWGMGIGDQGMRGSGIRDRGSGFRE